MDDRHDFFHFLRLRRRKAEESASSKSSIGPQPHRPLMFEVPSGSLLDPRHPDKQSGHDLQKSGSPDPVTAFADDDSSAILTRIRTAEGRRGLVR